MSYEMMIGLHVKDDDNYAVYREEIAPLLKKHGGGFRYDFRVSEALINEEKRPINRVFAIYFENKSRMNDFFSHEAYRTIKSKYFESSVEETTVISEYDRK